MPIYEYFCEKCGEVFQKLQKMDAGEKDVSCPLCGSHEVKRKISACAIGSSSGSSASGPACGVGGG